MTDTEYLLIQFCIKSDLDLAHEVLNPLMDEYYKIRSQRIYDPKAGSTPSSDDKSPTAATGEARNGTPETELPAHNPAWQWYHPMGEGKCQCDFPRIQNQFPYECGLCMRLLP